MLGVGISLDRAVNAARWWPEGASYALDLIGRRAGPVWYGAGGAFISAGLVDIAPLIESSLSRVTGQHTAPSGAVSANLDFFSVSMGKAINFSIRIVTPNKGEGSTPSSPLLSTGVPRTRVGDRMTLLLPPGMHSLTLTTAEGSQEIGTVSGAYIASVGIPKILVAARAVPL